MYGSSILKTVWIIGFFNISNGEMFRYNVLYLLVFSLWIIFTKRNGYIRTVTADVVYVVVNESRFMRFWFGDKPNNGSYYQSLLYVIGIGRRNSSIRLNTSTSQIKLSTPLVLATNLCFRIFQSSIVGICGISGGLAPIIYLKTVVLSASVYGTSSSAYKIPHNLTHLWDLETTS